MAANCRFKKILRTFFAQDDKNRTRSTESALTASFLVAGLVAALAFAARLLSIGGAFAATFVGAAALAAGTPWVVLLLFFFIGSNAMSSWRKSQRERLISSIVEKTARRDAWQVMANGGVFGVAAFLSTVNDPYAWQAIGAGAIAAATADTWSTEIGTVLGGTPHSIFTGREVPPGTSGGITIAGSIAAVAAAVLAAMVAVMLRWSTPAIAIISGGIAGAAVDSVLGATVQERRWCPTCEAPTERHVHSCGTATSHRGGIRRCNNDLVNLFSTVTGAVVTWILS